MNSMVQRGVADTIGTVKSPQDLFDSFFDNSRKGWWQRGDACIHQKIYIDSLFGLLDVNDFAGIARSLGSAFYLQGKFIIPAETGEEFSPPTKTKSKQLISKYSFKLKTLPTILSEPELQL